MSRERRLSGALWRLDTDHDRARGGFAHPGQSKEEHGQIEMMDATVEVRPIADVAPELLREALPESPVDGALSGDLTEARSRLGPFARGHAGNLSTAQAGNAAANAWRRQLIGELVFVPKLPAQTLELGLQVGRHLILSARAVQIVQLLRVTIEVAGSTKRAS